LNFRFPSAEVGYLPDGWSAWISDYQAWLARLSGGITDRGAVSDAIFTAYGLTARFGVILNAATSEAWKAQKGSLPADLGDDERVAIETGLANGLRLKLFAGIEHATRDFALESISTGDESFRRAFIRAVEKLEKSVGLLRVNLNAQAALESFLLASLRLWAARK
jgi:DNA polymerase-3 subunit delta'